MTESEYLKYLEENSYYRSSYGYCYGASVRNSECKPEETSDYYLLTTFCVDEAMYCNEGDIVIDVVPSSTGKRPELEKLIDKCEPFDSIIMPSIETLLKGKANNGIEYYKKILSKKIDLTIIDLDGGIKKYSPFSKAVDQPSIHFNAARILNNPKFYTTDTIEKLKKAQIYLTRKTSKRTFQTKNYFSFSLSFTYISGLFDMYSIMSFIHKHKLLLTDNDRIKMLEEYASCSKRKTNAGCFAKKDIITSKQFSEIYYAYESYQIDLPTTLELMKEFCGVNNKITFWQSCEKFEKSEYYDFFSHKDKKRLLKLPKRVGKISDEFFEIKEAVDKMTYPIKSKREKFTEFCKANDYLFSYENYLRWELKYEKEPMPRKPIPVNFDVKAFIKENRITPEELTPEELFQQLRKGEISLEEFNTKYNELENLQ